MSDAIVNDEKLISKETDRQIDSSNSEEENINAQGVTTAEFKIPFNVKKDLFFSREAPQDEELKEKGKFFFWNPPGRSSFEKKMVFKLDLVILTYTCLTFFVKFLDSSNLSYLYVSGLKEDYNLHGNMYNWIGTGYGIAYSICGLPSTLFMTKYKPHILLPCFEILWGTMCLLVIATKNFQGILAVRVFQGAIAGISFPSIHYILGSWYTKEELNKRTAIFVASGSLGSMFGGYIQSGIYESLNGKGNLLSWKWTFIIDFLITIPVALMGFLCLPDTPSEAKPNFYLSQEEIDFCRKRVEINEDLKEENKFDFSIIKRVFTSWQFYVFPVAYMMNQIGEYVSSFWGIVLKDEGYSVQQADNYPTIVSAVNVLCGIIAGWYCDMRGNRWEIYTIMNLFWVFTLAVIVAWDVPKGLLFFAYCCSNLSGVGSTVTVAWGNDLMQEDRQLRAFVLGSLNIFYLVLNTPLNNTVWNTDYAPKFEAGNRSCLVLQIMSTLFCIVIVLFDRYQRRKRNYISRMVKESGQLFYSATAEQKS